MEYNKNSYRNKFQKEVFKYEKITESKYIQFIYSLEQNVLENYFKKIHSKNKTVLDFACGSGRWTQYLENKFKNTVGIDVSQEMINFAKKKCKKTKFIITDITKNNNVTENKFDVITAFRFYKNAENTLRNEATKEITKYLNDDGYFIFDLHLNKFSFMGILASMIKLFRLNIIFNITPITLKTVSLKEINKILIENNLKITNYYGMGLLPGRSNWLLLPAKILYQFESWITRKKIMRQFCYNLLIFAKKHKSFS